MKKSSMTEFCIRLRNMTCFLFTWLCILVMVGSCLLRIDYIEVGMLLKLFAFSMLTAFLLVTIFSDVLFRKKSFMFRLTVLFVLFVPLEILFFYWLGLFSQRGSIQKWGFFASIVAVFYIASVIIDRTINAKKGAEYNQKLENYKHR